MGTANDNFDALAPDEQFAAMTLLAEAALAEWPGSFGDLRQVKLRENAVFAVTRDDGRRFALRVHRYDYHSTQALHSELAWMRALNDAGIGVPPIVPNRWGSFLAEVSHPAVPGSRQVDLLGWLEGVPVGTAEEGVASEGEDILTIFEKAGATAGAVHNHSSSWPGAANVDRHHWDLDGLLGPKPFWGQFWDMPGLDASQVELLQTARARAAREIAAFGSGGDRYGLIHADFVPENLLYDGERLNLIDFDDCGFGWHMFELATALFFTIHQPNYEALRAALFRGYRRERPLPRQHEALLPLFLFLRGTTYLGWMQTRSETQTAREMAPMMIERVTMLARNYLSGRETMAVLRA